MYKYEKERRRAGERDAGWLNSCRKERMRQGERKSLLLQEMEGQKKERKYQSEEAKEELTS